MSAVKQKKCSSRGCAKRIAPSRRLYCSLRCCSREAVRRFQANPANKDRLAKSRAKYLSSPKGIETRRRRESSPTRKAAVLAWARSARGKALTRASNKRRRTAVDGRVCVGCGRNDTQTTWSRGLARCEACDRTGHRNGWCSCGAPLWKGRGTGRLRDRLFLCRAECGATA